MANSIKRHKEKITPEEAFEGDLDAMNEMFANTSPKARPNFYKETELYEVSSDNYVIMDSDTAKMVQAKVSSGDFQKLVSLSTYLSSKLNILLNHKVPFTEPTLSKFLKMNKDNTVRFVKRMVKAGVMVYTVCAPSGYEQKVYIMNPQLFRKGKLYHESLLNLYFPSFTENFINYWNDGELNEDAIKAI